MGWPDEEAQPPQGPSSAAPPWLHRWLVHRRAGQQQQGLLLRQKRACSSRAWQLLDLALVVGHG